MGKGEPDKSGKLKADLVPPEVKAILPPGVVGDSRGTGGYKAHLPEVPFEKRFSVFAYGSHLAAAQAAIDYYNVCFERDFELRTKSKSDLKEMCVAQSLDCFKACFRDVMLSGGVLFNLRVPWGG